MAINLSTQIPQLLFSSAIPDLAINTDGDGEVEIALTSAGNTVFTASHFPYNRQVKVYDLRSVVEYYMRSQGSSLMDFAITADDGSGAHLLCSFKVIYLEHRFDGDIAVFLRNNFLTTMAGKLTSPDATEFLHFFIAAGSQETVRYQVVASVDGIAGGEPRVYQLTENCGTSNYDRVHRLEVTYEVMMGLVESPAQGRPRDAITIHAYSVHAGARAFTFYVQRHEPPLSLYFRNAFNVFERCDLQAVTTHKPKVDRSIAVTNRISTFYNQQNEKEYEVETSGLTVEQARWIEQLCYSHDVRLAIFYSKIISENII